MGDENFTHKKYEDELTLIFDNLSMFQEGVFHNTVIVTERVTNMEAYTLPSLTPQGSSQLEKLVEKILELE